MIPALHRNTFSIAGISKKYEIIESKVSGVKLGTEIRGFFVDNPADPIRAFPRFSLYIAKEFRLSKIAELLSAN